MIINCILILIALFSTICALGNWMISLEILSHIQFWLLSPLLFTFGVSLLFKRKLLAGWILALLVYHSAMVYPLFIDNENTPTGSSSAPIKVLLLNFHANNSQYKEVIESITKEDPDIFVICEANWHLINRMGDLENQYPYVLETGRWPNSTMLGVSGTALFSKFPFKESRALPLKKSFIQALEATVSFPATDFKIIATHPPSPVTKSQHRRRNKAFEEIQTLLSGNESTIIVGDFNNTIHSASMRTFLGTTGLHSVYKGQGMHTTWPSKYYPFGFAIDHIFLSEDWNTTSLKTVRAPGSDHRMLVAEITHNNHD